MRTLEITNNMIINPIDGEVREDGVLLGYALNSKEYTPLTKQESSLTNQADLGVVTTSKGRDVNYTSMILY